MPAPKRFVVQVRDTTKYPHRWRDDRWFEDREPAEEYVRELAHRDIGGRVQEGYQP